MTDKNIPVRAKPSIQVDNDRVRITEWRFAIGAATGFHRHAFDYAVVPLTTGQLRLVAGDGSETVANLVEGASYYRQAGVEHDVINANSFEFAFVEIELK
jgi:beta-alanine degradation protein BauB